MELLVKNLHKEFKKNVVIQDVSFTLACGVHALLGANGSGKTTLIRMLCGILPSDKGEIYFDGIPINKQYATYCSYLGYMPQHFGFYPNYTVDEFLQYMCIVKKLPEEVSQTRIKELMRQLNLTEQKKKKMRQLSGGMLRRVGIASALLNDPKILILDEPTAGLDPKERIIFRNLIASLSKKCLIILSTHIVSDIESIADDILVMKNGSVILQDTCDHLLSTMKNKVWTLHTTDEKAQELMSSMIIVKHHQREKGMDLRLISDTCPDIHALPVEPDLDDLYLYHFHEEGECL